MGAGPAAGEMSIKGCLGIRMFAQTSNSKLRFLVTSIEFLLVSILELKKEDSGNFVDLIYQKLHFFCFFTVITIWVSSHSLLF